MGRLRRYLKVLVLDTLAGLCFLGVLLFGWLPGPGGIPLLLAGLALLAVNHDWAERWLETVRLKGKSLKKILFPDIAWVRHTYDTLSVLLFSFAVWLFLTTHNRWVAGVGMAIACLSLFVFLVNRERLDKLGHFLHFRKK